MKLLKQVSENPPQGRSASLPLPRRRDLPARGDIQQPVKFYEDYPQNP